MTPAEKIAECCRLNELYRRDTIQRFTNAHPDWKPEQALAVVSKTLFIEAGIEPYHEVFQTPSYKDIPEGY